MSNLINPAAVIFINPQLSAGVLAQLVQQLYITEVQTAAEFDNHIDGYGDGYMDENDYLGDGYISDGYYVERVHGRGERILVLRDPYDLTNREEADIVLSYRRGLVYVEANKYGPPGKCLPLQHVYLRSLFTEIPAYLGNTR